MKEEQLSEAWSLDADPPESVNDPLDENTSNQSCLLAGNNRLNFKSAKSIYGNNSTIATNLISFGNEQVIISGCVVDLELRREYLLLSIIKFNKISF